MFQKKKTAGKKQVKNSVFGGGTAVENIEITDVLAAIDEVTVEAEVQIKKQRTFRKENDCCYGD